jgi:hypothetical protein
MNKKNSDRRKNHDYIEAKYLGRVADEGYTGNKKLVH